MGLILASLGAAAILLGGLGGWYYVEHWAGGWGDTAPAESSAANNQVPGNAATSPPSEAGRQPPVNQPAEPPNRTAEVLDFVRDYPGGECLFASPTQVGENHVAIGGFSNRPEPLAALVSAVKEKFGFEPTARFLQVSDAQCVVVGALRRLTSNGARRPALELNREVVRSGHVLRGTVAGLGSRHVEFLMVDHQGFVYLLTEEHTKKEGDTIGFAITLDNAPTRQEPQLMLSVTSAAPLRSLSNSWSQQGYIPADQLIPDLLDEISKQPSEVATAAAYFTFGK